MAAATEASALAHAARAEEFLATSEAAETAAAAGAAGAFGAAAAGASCTQPAQEAFAAAAAETNSNTAVAKLAAERGTQPSTLVSGAGLPAAAAAAAGAPAVDDTQATGAADGV